MDRVVASTLEERIDTMTIASGKEAGNIKYFTFTVILDETDILYPKGCRPYAA
jgi:hypothetical protein